MLARALPPGAAVPSVRELARELRVNPATVAKAFQRLVDSGLLVIRRGEGTFVAEATPAHRSAEREALLRDAALRFATTASGLGLGLGQSQEALTAAWPSLQIEHPGESR